MSLGVKSVTPEIIQEMVKQRAAIDWPKVRSVESRLKHDVMAHIEVYGEACSTAKGIIHLGATSCYVQVGLGECVRSRADIYYFDLRTTPT